MAWSGRTDPKYRTIQHRRERKRWADELRRRGTLQCAQDICIRPDRTIHHGEPWHLGHDHHGTTYIGPVHPDCNIADAARRGHANSRNAKDTTSGWFA